MTTEYAQIWSAVAASFSAIAALTIVRISHRNMIDSATPEIIIDGWDREKKKILDKDYDILTFTKILNTGKGSALHVHINTEDMVSSLPKTMFTTKRIAIIPSGKEVNLKGEITLLWKNADKQNELIPIDITIYAWSTKGYRYETVYRLMAMDTGHARMWDDTSTVATGIMLLARRTISRPVWRLKLNRYLSGRFIIGKYFKKST